MAYRYVVLGAGRQGTAIAYDLARLGEATRVALADVDPAAAEAAAQRVRALLGPRAPQIAAEACDVSRSDDVLRVLRGAHAAVSAVPYRFNVGLTEAAIAARCCLCDLGGNTDVVRSQLELHPRALAAGVSVVPDCGLAPGLGNHLAAYGVSRLDQPEHVHVRCGGLPRERVGPLGYKMLFNFQGLINEYSGMGEFLRDGALTLVPTLTEVEDIEFPPPVGRCEAAVTSGGTSTCPRSFLGRLTTYDYKTVRYPGHFAVIRALFDLGCFEESIRFADGVRINPKAAMRRLFEERLRYPDVRDLVVLRVTVRGRHAGLPRTLTFDVLDHHDEATGFTAMERTTGFPTAIVAHMQAAGAVDAGARPLELSVPAAEFYARLAQHDIVVKETGADG